MTATKTYARVNDGNAASDGTNVHVFFNAAHMTVQRRLRPLGTIVSRLFFTSSSLLLIVTNKKGTTATEPHC